MRTALLTIITCVGIGAFEAASASKAGTPRTPQATPQHQGEMVSLPVLVLDRHSRPVADLKEDELELYEGKEKQSIESLRPSLATLIDVGFLIDASRSEVRSRRITKLPEDTGLAGEVLHAGDRAFVAAFGESPSLVCPPTTDITAVAKVLRDVFGTKISGGTSLYDAVYWAAAPRASNRAARKALIILSDMQDNTSNHTKEEATALAQRSGTLIYPIVLGELIPRVDRVARSLAEDTGGVYFTPMTPAELRETFRNIRTYLENTYVLQYRPRSPKPGPIKIRCTRKGVKLVAPHQRY